MKRIIIILFTVLLLSVIILGACAKPSPAPAPAPAPAPTPAPAPPSEKPIELKFSHFAPPMVWFFKPLYTPWIKEIEERSKGRVKITLFPAQSLGNIQDQYEMTRTRIADIAAVDLGIMSGVFPLSSGISLPLIFNSTEAVCLTSWELTEKYLKDTELKDVKVLWYQCVPPGHIHTSNKPIHTLEDLSDVKIASPSEAGIHALEKLGATPVFIPITELYTSLERGLVDGTVVPWEASFAFKTMEVTKYRTVVGLFAPVLNVIMNRDAWNSLPPDIQKLVEETGGVEMSRAFGAGFDEVERNLENVIKAHDQEKGNPEVYYLPEEEKAKWREAITPLYEEWIAEREAEGLPARAFFEDLLQTAAKYNK